MSQQPSLNMDTDAMYQMSVEASYDIAQNIIQKYKAGTLKKMPIITSTTADMLYDLCLQEGISFSKVTALL